MYIMDSVEQNGVDKKPRPNYIEELLRIQQYIKVTHRNVFFVKVMTEKMMKIWIYGSMENDGTYSAGNVVSGVDMMEMAIILLNFLLLTIDTTNVTDICCVILNYIISNELNEITFRPCVYHVLYPVQD